MMSNPLGVQDTLANPRVLLDRQGNSCQITSGGPYVDDRILKSMSPSLLCPRPAVRFSLGRIWVACMMILVLHCSCPKGTFLFQIIEYLIIRLQYGKKRQPVGCSTTEGVLVLSVDIENSLQDVNQSHCVTIISSKGDAWHELLSDELRKEIETLLLPLRLSKTQRGRGCPHECPHNMPFQFSFELCEASEVLERDCLAMKQFIHRISLVCTMIKFHFCVKVNGSVSAETYSSDSKASIYLPDGKKLLTDRSHFMRPLSKDLTSSCEKIHPVTGEGVDLFIPEEAAQGGFSGELRLTPVAAVCPCRKPFPHQPTRITALSVFLYDPAGLPVFPLIKDASCSFFEDPSCFTAWEKYSYHATRISDPYWEEGTAKPDVRYDLHGSHEHDPDAMEQSLLLFLFLTHADPFQDKPTYNFCDRQIILSHLSSILLCSKQTVKDALHGVISGLLEQHRRAAQEQQRVAHVLPIMAEAVSSIVSSSCDSEFRRKCLQSLQVSDTHELQLTLKESFSKVILQLWKPSSTCDIRKPLPKNDKPGHLSIEKDVPSDQQTLPSAVGLAGLEQTGNESCGKEGLSSNRSEMGGISRTRKRRSRKHRELSEEDSGDPAASEDAKRKRQTGTSPEALSCENLVETSWQDDDFWDREVSNLAEWTP
uniref:Type 2 DNA topoisomerase 6 subunit B-like isoform X1 n=1 Tax=Pogona vitticeps TaxID=103695 RepID=A0ABM5F525_9SAUR